MGAPQVIPTPTKAYVAINCFSSDKSIPPTLCDLGRVSSIASAVTLPRTSSFVNRNIGAQNTGSLCNKKRPISEVLGDSNSEINQNQSLNSASAAHSTLEINSVRKDNSTSVAKRTRQESTISGMVSSPKPNKTDIQKNISVSMPKESQRTTSTSHSVNLPLMNSQELKPEPFRNQHKTIHYQHTTQLPNQEPVLLHAPVIGKLPTQSTPPLTLQLHQQNQQLRSENLILQKQLNLFRQLMKNPQRLNQVLTRLEQNVC